MEHHRRAVIDGVASSKNRDSKGGELNLGMGKKEQVIRWERFLPRRFLRVLLVENDDCTRHIVAALLRKCSYQVAAVADGLKAWEVLKEKCYNFDLVLTEVVMPSLSGIGLLSKIMSNDICKNIPVIMMSSHDSIGIVFKCMLKGAADFLVKPVRKNELRNLWQHVWRKCCSNSCGNGSENGIPNWPKLEAVADNDVDSNHGSANAGNRSETGDGSDEESDTQSSCSKPETGIKSVQNLREPFESEYMSLPEEIGSTSEKHDFDMAKAVFPLSMHEKGKAKDKSTGVEIKVTSPIGGPASTKNFWEKNGFYDGFPCREEDLASVRSKDGGITDLEPLDQIKEANEPSKEIIDFVGATTNERCRFPILEDNDHGKDILCKNGKSSDVKRCTYNSGPLLLLELSLRRPQLKRWDDEVFQEKHVLNHSDSSAFSRYCGVSMHHSCPTSGSSASLSIRTSDFGAANCHINSGTDNGRSLTFPLLERMLSPRRNGTEALICCQMSSGGNKEGAGTSASGTLRENAFVGHSSIEKTVFPHPQLGALQIHIPVGAIPSQSLSAGYGALMQPNFNPEPSVPPYGSSEVEKETKLRLSKPFTRDLNHLVNDLQHVNCHPCFENHHPHRLKQGMEEQRANIKFAYPRAVLHTPCEIKDQVDDCGHGLTDASGSNGSNEDTSVAVNTGAALDSGNEDGLQNCNGKVSDHDYSRREAALTRFRLKRKDRCFEKKVRYHSRKKLAEKRSRLKGQFVRQSVTELTMIATEQDD